MFEFVAGDQIGVSALGSTLAYYRNGTQQFTRTDATYGAAGKIGLLMENTTGRWDNFGGGTFFKKLVGNNFRLAGAGGLAS